MLKVFFVARQNPDDRKWLPVGKLTVKDNKYIFSYTKGALQSKGFNSFGRMNKFRKIYESDELFPFFTNRILSEKRPEYVDFLRWLNLSSSSSTQLDMLALGGGKRGTDNLEVFQCPAKDERNRLTIKFFSHGISHLDTHTQKRVCDLLYGTRLYLMQDVQNRFDFNAIALRTDDPVALVRYCPRYLVDDVNSIIQETDAELINVNVERVNADAPMQYKLLCRLDAPWPTNYNPCSTDMYKSIVEDADEGCLL